MNVTCILFLIMVSFKAHQSMFLQSQRRGFLAVTVSNMALFAIDAVWVFVNNNLDTFGIAANWIINGAYFVASGLAGFFWFAYSEDIQQSAFVKNKKLMLVAALPAVILIVLALTSYFSHFLYYIDETNTYHRGPGYPLQLVIAYGYVIFTAVKAFIVSFHASDYRMKREYRSLSTYVIPSLVFGTLQIFFPGYPLLSVGTTLGVVYIYLSLQSQMISVDALTKLNNRSQLFQYLSIKNRHLQDDHPVYLMMIDVNKFKYINDQYGHIEGDNALKLIAGSLKKTCNGRNYFIARYGGDEFTVVCEPEKSSSIENVCRQICDGVKGIVAPYSLSVSIGYARLDKGIKSQQELIAKADKEMYKAKLVNHQQGKTAA